MSEPSRVLGPVADYYSNRAREHGARPQGVDWNSPEAQELRWTQFLSLFDTRSPFSVIDYGCGYGGFHTWLASQGIRHEYVGYDISAEQVEGAAKLHGDDSACSFVADGAALPMADYIVGSGIFNVKLEASDEEWEASIRETLDLMAGRAGRGFGFNMLTSYSDPDRRRAHLYHGDPARWVTYCLGKFSRHLVLKHDYGLYDFTILVRLDG